MIKDAAVFPRFVWTCNRATSVGFNAGDPRRLAKSSRLDFLELHPRLGLQAGYRIKIDPVRDAAVFIGTVALDVGLLAEKVAFVLDLRLKLRGDIRLGGIERRGEIAPRNIRPASADAPTAGPRA